jgi:DNA-binding response OmpR family regulator
MIVLSAVDDEEEKSRLLDEGADDYLVKPFSSRELLARIRAILRRTSVRPEATARFGDVEVNLERRIITRHGRELQVCRAEYKLLRFFLQNVNRPLTREEILESVWGYQSSNTRTVDMHVARLRSALERNVNAPRHILTIHRVGYRFVA